MNEQMAMEVIKNNGYKMTKQRKDILRFFAQEDRYHTAKNLYDHMEKSHPGISFDTVYRNLHLYHDLGILESTDLNAEKNFRMHCGGHHHHHFICNRCGKTKEIDICPMDDALKLLGNYKIEAHKFEVYGLCPDCQIAV